ncbi:RpiB/LacA/LacB family sugar-phosphate isomerase, partial [Candidatus Peregrinibacteria bacterium]|nr:RpiB/LacA/LacB family sugar-phosphate isomerase [Candidatus Peregrinibacteria bacterium]
MSYPERIVLATDHGGYKLKEHLKKYLISKGVDVIDVGTFSEESIDY